MPSHTLVYEDSAPFFTYNGKWNQGGSRFDDFADQYSESSFTVTQTAGATFSFSFYGSAVGIYGAKRGNHGSYQVTVDGNAFSTENGSAEPSEYNATLFSTSLTKGTHTVSLRNNENRFTDIDFVSWETSIGEDNETLIVNTVQDSHPSFVYQPEDRWTTDIPFVSSFSGGNGHGTNSIGAVATLTFQGDAVALYGSSGPKSASLYSVQVDNRTSESFIALKRFYRARQLLYFAGNLGPGTHRLNITLGATSSDDELLTIDYAEIYTAPSLGGSFAALDGVQQLSTSSWPPGFIAAVAVTSAAAGIALLILLFLLIMFLTGRIRRHSKNDAEPHIAAGNALYGAHHIHPNGTNMVNASEGHVQGASFSSGQYISPSMSGTTSSGAGRTDIYGHTYITKDRAGVGASPGQPPAYLS